MQSVDNTSKTDVNQYTLKMRFVPHREHDVHQIRSESPCALRLRESPVEM